jgi:anti-sigma B factor antagonist
MQAATALIPMPHVSIGKIELGGRSVVNIVGDLDMETSDEVLSALQDALRAQGRRPLILNLGGVGHLDSSGLGALIAARFEAKQRKVRFVLSNMTDAQSRMLARMKLNRFFEISRTLADALSLTEKRETKSSNRYSSLTATAMSK